jgi:hypothetical protein
MSVKSEVLFRPALKFVMIGQLFCRQNQKRSLFLWRGSCFLRTIHGRTGGCMFSQSSCPPSPPPNLMACKGNTVYSFRYICVSAFCHFPSRFQIHEILVLFREKLTAEEMEELTKISATINLNSNLIIQYVRYEVLILSC